MPHRRPPPVRLDLKATSKKRPAPKSKLPKPKKTSRPRKPRDSGEDSSLPYWIAGGLIVLLAVLGGVYHEAPEIKSWFAGTSSDEVPPENLLPLPQKPEVAPQPSEDEIRAKELKEKEAAEKALEAKRLEAERLALKAVPAPTPTPPPTPVAPPKPVVKIAPPPPAPVVQMPPAPLPNAEPPLVQPVPIAGIQGAPARALPLDPNKLDTERIAAYQVALERIHFSCGFVDGDQGMRTQRMLRAFQASRGLPITGFLDQPTRDAIGEPGEPFLTYTVTADDVGSIMPKPQTWIAKSKATRLGYNDIWELLAEKFHCTRGVPEGAQSRRHHARGGHGNHRAEGLSRRADSARGLASHFAVGHEHRGARRQRQDHRVLPLLHREGQEQAAARTAHGQGGRSASRLHIRPGALRRRGQGRGHHAQDGAGEERDDLAAGVERLDAGVRQRNAKRGRVRNRRGLASHLAGRSVSSRSTPPARSSSPSTGKVTLRFNGETTRFDNYVSADHLPDSVF